MISDLTLCLAASATYYTPPTVLVEDVHVCITDIDGTICVGVKGTNPDSMSDWLRDFEAIPAENQYLGLCHQGFLDGALLVLEPVWAIVKDKPFVIVGHSLGGGIGIPLGALLIAKYNQTPMQLVTWGAPKINIGGHINTYLKNVPGARYHNGNDPVPDVPTWPYQHDRPLTAIGEPSSNPICCHYLDSYYPSLEKFLHV